MTLATVQSILYEAIWTTLLVAGPLLAVTSVIGLIISLLQAVTQMNEASLSFIPKLIASGLMLLAFGSWMLQTMITFVVRMLSGPGAT